MSSINIILADAQLLIRVGLRHLLASNPAYHIIGEVAYEDDLLELLTQQESQVVILDYAQSENFSTETIQKIKKVSPHTNILIISADEDRKSIYRVIEDGINSYLTKECQEKEILDAVEATIKGEKFFCNNVLNHILEKSFPREPNCEPTPLTPREIEVVKLVANGLIAKEIADELNLSTHTIYTHRKNIMKKLNINNASEMVMYAVNNGIV